ncbi:hypothetical protein KI387_031863, partial [Taxus chinensis]
AKVSTKDMGKDEEDSVQKQEVPSLAQEKMAMVAKEEETMDIESLAENNVERGTKPVLNKEKESAEEDCGSTRGP